MRKSIIEAVKKNGRHETKKYIYTKMVTPNGFVILQYSQYSRENYYPCVVYVQK